ncbi:MAG: lysylphosphatidylglycerol synthase transmembrane domain-containing protein [Caldisphaera sp.]|uniref:lysylphosphatidylglycerol synthase transmembrane domain-containing protein n=1 Tax=Caldisphaera sp. TaxID=2060322 RepID=UPI0039782E85
MSRKNILMIAVLLIIMMAVFSIITENPIKVLYIIYKGNVLLLYSFLLIILSEIVKSFRLYYICNSSKRCKLNFIEAVEIQFNGFFAGTITPGNFGGVPTVAGLINKYTQSPMGEAFGISSLQSFFDGIIPSIISFILSLYYLPKSIGITIFSLSTIIFWILVFNVNIKNFFMKLISKIGKDSLKQKVIYEIDKFQNLLKIIGNKKLIINSIAITLIAYIIQIFSIKVLLENLDISFLNIFIALMFNYSMATFPTPAGEGGTEYGLSLLLPLNVVILWRLTYVLSGLLSGGFSYLTFKRLKK